MTDFSSSGQRSVAGDRMALEFGLETADGGLPIVRGLAEFSASSNV